MFIKRDGFRLTKAFQSSLLILPSLSLSASAIVCKREKWAVEKLN